jgi:nucleoside-diphosphate-sugar epimerase
VSEGDKPAIIVTGISGNLGSRLLPLLGNFKVIGVDMVPPRSDLSLRFEKVDLGREAACRQLVQLFQDHKPRAIVHLAFVLDPVRTGVLDINRMWQINVAGTARVMEAITEINRHGGAIDTFIFPSSVAVYGPDTPGPVKETYALGAHTLPYALHKRECDEVVRLRHQAMGNCTTYLLRPHIFTGASMQNYMVGVLRGTPTGKSKRAERMRQEGKRLPLLVPGKRCLESRLQFVHVDDVARLLAHILHASPAKKNELKVLNVAGRGEPITLNQAAAIARARVIQVPGKWIVRLILSLLWKWGVSGVPPSALPYMIGSYTMDTTRLKQFLGQEYERVIRYTVSTSLQDCFESEQESRLSASHS